MIAIHKLIKLEPFSRDNFDWSKDEFSFLWYSADWDEKEESKPLTISISNFESDLLEYYKEDPRVKDGCDAIDKFFDQISSIQEMLIVDHIIQNYAI